MKQHWVDQGLDAGQQGGAGNEGGGYVQAARAIAQQPAPMHQPAEFALHDPTPLEHDEAFLLGVALDHAIANAVLALSRSERCWVGLLLAMCGRERLIQHRLAQARPGLLARVQGRRRVALLHVRGHEGDSTLCANGRVEGRRTSQQ